MRAWITFGITEERAEARESQGYDVERREDGVAVERLAIPFDEDTDPVLSRFLRHLTSTVAGDEASTVVISDGDDEKEFEWPLLAREETPLAYMRQAVQRIEDNRWEVVRVANEDQPGGRRPGAGRPVWAPNQVGYGPRVIHSAQPRLSWAATESDADAIVAVAEERLVMAVDPVTRKDVLVGYAFLRVARKVLQAGTFDAVVEDLGKDAETIRQAWGGQGLIDAQGQPTPLLHQRLQDERERQSTWTQPQGASAP